MVEDEVGVGVGGGSRGRVCICRLAFKALNQQWRTDLANSGSSFVVLAPSPLSPLPLLLISLSPAHQQTGRRLEHVIGLPSASSQRHTADSVCWLRGGCLHPVHRLVRRLALPLARRPTRCNPWRACNHTRSRPSCSHQSQDQNRFACHLAHRARYRCGVVAQRRRSPQCKSPPPSFFLSFLFP